MQRTLKRESKVLEIVKRETAGARKTSRFQRTFHGGEGVKTPPRRRLEATSSVSEAGGRRRERTISSMGSSRPSEDFPSSTSAHPSPGRVSVGRERARQGFGGGAAGSDPRGRTASSRPERPLDRGEAHWKRAAARPGVGPPQGGTHLSTR
jgi:hypothetical protein